MEVSMLITPRFNPLVNFARSREIRIHRRSSFGRLPGPKAPLCYSFRPVNSRYSVRASTGDCLSSSENGQRKLNAFEEAIFQLEGMLREPAEVLDGMRERLSAQDLQLVLNYFAEEGRDSWFALEVFEWMQKVNMVGDGTHQLMMSIMYNWAMKMVEQGQPVEQVSSLLEDMHYVGLKPESRIMQSVISAYWEKGKKSEALTFVKQVMSSEVHRERADDPLGYLILKMVRSKECGQALKLVSEFRKSGFSLKASTYNAALLAAVAEQEQLANSLHRLKIFQRKGLIRLDESDTKAINAYEKSLHEAAEQIAEWVAEEKHTKAFMPSIYERLLAMYCLAGKGLDAERTLWQLKLAGRPPAPEMFNTIIGIRAFNKQPEEAFQFLRKMEASGKEATKKTFSVLIGGFAKGGSPIEAAAAMLAMLDRGFQPAVPEMLVVLKALQGAGLVSLYLKLAKALSQAGLIEPCTLYFYVDSFKLCIIRMM